MFNLLHNMLIPLVLYQFFDWQFSIVYFTSLLITWYLYKNECMISYLHKKQTNTSYKIGDSPFETDDFMLSNSKFMPIRIDKLIYIVAIPYFYYNITKNVVNSCLLALSIMFIFMNETWFVNFMLTRKRYILLVIIIFALTNQSMTNNEYIKKLYKMSLYFLIALSSVSLYVCRDEEDIYEITLVSAIIYTYMIIKYDINLLK